MKARGYTLIATMITFAIIMILMVVYMTGGLGGSLQKNTGMKPRADGRGPTIPGMAIARAEDEACKSNLRQVNQGLQLSRLETDEKPQSIEEARIGESFYNCPLGGERYELDPETGKARCKHPGHEKY